MEAIRSEPDQTADNDNDDDDGENMQGVVGGNKTE